MQLRTEWLPPKKPLGLDVCSPITLVGSCFASYLDGFLGKSGMASVASPTGICYNPLTVATALDYLEGAKEPSPTGIISHGSWTCHYDFHGEHAAADPDLWQQQAAARIREAKTRFQSSSTVIITLGTSWVYHHKQLGQVVNNCHKQPARLFERKLLPHTLAAQELIPRLRKVAASNRTVLLTVSPVRHLRDDMHQNQSSKAHLHLLVDQLLAEIPGAKYFPAYEILMDDLRDYRFYAEDMAHPNRLALDYVWQKFCRFAFDETAQTQLDRFQNLHKLFAHRPVADSGIAQHQQLCQEELKKLQQHFRTWFGCYIIRIHIMG